jgi:hypothetical protein
VRKYSAIRREWSWPYRVFFEWAWRRKQRALATASAPPTGAPSPQPLPSPQPWLDHFFFRAIQKSFGGRLRFLIVCDRNFDRQV